MAVKQQDMNLEQLREHGSVVGRAFDAGAKRERAAIVAWILTQSVPAPHAVRANEKTVQMLATAIERGAHMAPVESNKPAP